MCSCWLFAFLRHISEANNEKNSQNLSLVFNFYGLNNLNIAIPTKNQNIKIKRNSAPF